MPTAPSPKPQSLNDDDPEYKQLVALARAWNRACKSVRNEFAQMVNEANTGVIDP